MKLTRKRLTARATVKLDVYRLVARAVEEGISIGWNRAHKHTDHPHEETIKNAIENEVMSALSDVIVWPDIHSDLYR